MRGKRKLPSCDASSPGQRSCRLSVASESVGWAKIAQRPMAHHILWRGDPVSKYVFLWAIMLQLVGMVLPLRADSPGNANNMRDSDGGSCQAG